MNLLQPIFIDFVTFYMLRYVAAHLLCDISLNKKAIFVTTLKRIDAFYFSRVRNVFFIQSAEFDDHLFGPLGAG